MDRPPRGPATSPSKLIFMSTALYVHPLHGEGSSYKWRGMALPPPPTRTYRLYAGLYRHVFPSRLEQARITTACPSVTV